MARVAGMALVGCANSEGRSSGSSHGVGQDEKTRLCLRAIRRLGAAAGGGDGTAMAVDGGSGVSTMTGGSFAEAALDLACGVVEREWAGKKEEGSQNGASNAAEEVSTLVRKATWAEIVLFFAASKGLDRNHPSRMNSRMND